MNKIYGFLILGLASFLSACTTAPKPIGPLVHVLSTNRPPADLLPEIETRLKKNKYEVIKLDVQVGLLSMRPRQFSVDHKGKKVAAQQVLQLRQEGGSLKLRAVYKCQYELGAWATCVDDDPKVSQKINRIDKLVVDVVAADLVRDRADRPEATSIGDIIPPEPKK